MQKQFSLLGDCITSYKGEGVLTLQDDSSIPCTFEVGQLKRGDIFMFCDSPVSTLSPLFTPARKFEGTTTQGHAFTSFENFSCTDSYTNSVGGMYIYILRDSTIYREEQTLLQRAHYGITNLVINHSLHIQIDHKDTIQQVAIKPIDNHEIIMWRVRTLKSIDVTCEIIVEVTDNLEKETLDELVENLCYLLSVAKGTKIEWLYRDIYNTRNLCVESYHTSHVTKPYCPLYLIEEDRTLGTFLEKTYKAYILNREHFAFKQGTIDAYLDAKAEGDYLQMRGVKLATTMEMIKDVFLKLANSSIRKGYISSNQFKRISSELGKAILPILHDANPDITEEIVKSKVPDLNRRPFKEILARICEQIGLQITEEDIQYFVKSRDELIHTALFQSEKKLRGTENIQPVIDEFCFLMNVLDKIFLRLLEYNGLYVDRRVPSKPNRFAQI